MGFHFGISHNERDISEVAWIKHSQKVSWHLRLWHLDTDREHPNVVETEFTVVSPEDVELSLDDVCGVPAPRSRLELASSDFLPVVCLDVKHMDIIHPMHSIIPSEVDDFRVYKAACGRDSSARTFSSHFWTAPGKRLGIKVEDIVELSELIRLSSEDENFLVVCDGGMLETAVGSLTLCCDWSRPFKVVQVKHEQLIEPVLAVTTSKHKHLVVYNARCVELAHRSLASDNLWNIETQFIDALFQIDENDIRQDLESVPSTVNDNLTAVPYLR